MKRYDSYKNSGVEWIGEVPEHWEVCKIKRLSVVKRGASPRPIENPIYFDDNGQYAWVRISDVTDSKKYLYSTTQKLSKLGASLSVKMHSGEIFLSIAGTVGKPIITKIDCCIHDGFVWFPNLKLEPEFLYYVFMSGRPYLGLGKLGTQLNLNTETVGYISIPIPEGKEIIEIVSYLDSRCGEVDKVISTQEKRISLLQELKQSLITNAVTKGLNPDVKMKDSGIEWIGEVPEHWKIIRMKYICEFNGRIGFRGYSQADLVSEGEGAITLSPTNMNDMYVDYNKCSYLSWKKYYESPEIMVKQGDVLLVKTASVGKCSYVKTVPMECTVNPQILVLKKHRQNPMFLTYLFQISLGQTYIELYKAGSTIPTLSEDKIGNFRFAFPSDNEQNEIVSYLDKRCVQIDASISKAQKEIELLQEYKQSLITEVVTGKRKVC